MEDDGRKGTCGFRSIAEQQAAWLTPFSNFEGGAELDERHDTDHDGISSRARTPNVPGPAVEPATSRVQRRG